MPNMATKEEINAALSDALVATANDRARSWRVGEDGGTIQTFLDYARAQELLARPHVRAAEADRNAGAITEYYDY